MSTLPLVPIQTGTAFLLPLEDPGDFWDEDETNEYMQGGEDTDSFFSGLVDRMARRGRAAPRKRAEPEEKPKEEPNAGDLLYERLMSQEEPLIWEEVKRATDNEAFKMQSLMIDIDELQRKHAASKRRSENLMTKWNAQRREEQRRGM